MIHLKEAIIVEGKYDKMRLIPIVDATIIETNGFRIFKDPEKINLIKQLADKTGILVLTDSDSAGFLIRNHLKGVVDSSKIKHAYIPQILGKEKRKSVPSKEGTLGVEGMSEEILTNALVQAGVSINKGPVLHKGKITKQDFFKLGLTGGTSSKQLRTKLLNQLCLPSYLTTNALIDVLNSTIALTELCELVDIIKNNVDNHPRR